MPRLRTAADYYISPKIGPSISRKSAVSQSEIAALQNMSHAELADQWRQEFGAAVPHNLSKRLLINALAYELQVKAYGGLKKATKQMLADAVAITCYMDKKQNCSIIAGCLSQLSAQTPPPVIILSPGTRLMREWRGVVHVVDVVEGGFIWSGKPHRSLSAIARTITGVRWNGLAFFGLRKRKECRANGSDSISSNTITSDASHSYGLGRSPTLNGDASEADNLATAAPITAHDILSPSTGTVL